jgi:hypothetical protein
LTRSKDIGGPLMSPAGLADPARTTSADSSCRYTGIGGPSMSFSGATAAVHG